LAASSAGDAGRYLQVFSGGVVERAHVPPEDLERLFGIRAATTRDRNGREAAREGSTSARPNGADAANMSAASLPAIMPLIFADPQAGGQRLADPRPATPAPAPVLPPVMPITPPIAAPITPPAPLFVAADITLAPLPTTLVWGRFSEPLQIPVTLTSSYEEARQGRHVTVGELTQYALWRNDPRATLFPGLTGQATFALAAAQVFYRTGANNEVATVAGARLTADFDLARFATELALRTASGVSTVLSASGRINDEGIFLSLAPDGSQRVAGAFSRNGTEAGYLFNKVVGNGVFQGITLWGVRP
jgi:hypothetical protein